MQKKDILFQKILPWFPMGSYVTVVELTIFYLPAMVNGSMHLKRSAPVIHMVQISFKHVPLQKHIAAVPVQKDMWNISWKQKEFVTDTIIKERSEFTV